MDEKFDCCVCRVLPVDSVLCQMKPIIILRLSFSYTPFNVVLLSAHCLLSILFPSYFAPMSVTQFPSVHESCCIYQPEERLCRVS